jgi:hypothetical protein
MRLYFLPYFLFLLFACDQPTGSDDISKENSGSDEKTDTIIEYTYKSNSEVEELIEKQSHRFLSYFWYGMSENQCLEVLRYLMDQGTVDAFLLKGDEKDPLEPREIKSCKVKNQTVGYSFPTDSPRIIYHIQMKESTLNFEVNFNFGLKDDSLLSLSMTTLSWHNTIADISLKNYNYLVEIFSEKYGKIVDHTSQELAGFADLNPSSKLVEYRRCRFLKDGISVELEYTSKKPEYENSYQIFTIYYSLHLDKKFSTYDDDRRRYEVNERERERERVKEQERIKQEILKRQRESTLERI